MNLSKLRKDRSGIVFVTVLVIIMVMMIMTVSIISLNVTQVKVTEDDVRRIQAEMLAQGAVNYYYADQQMKTPTGVIVSQVNMQKNTFSIPPPNLDTTANSGKVFNTLSLTINVDF